MKDIKFEKRGDRYIITVALENGQRVERDFPCQAVDGIMKVLKLNEFGACEYLAVHQWKSLDQVPPPPHPAQAPVAYPPPEPTRPPRPLQTARPPPPPPPPPAPPMPTEAPKRAKAKGKDDTLDELLGELEGKAGDEEEIEGEDVEPEGEDPKEKDRWDNYDWLLEQCRVEGYFGRPGSQSRKKEDLQKWLHKKLKR